MSKKYKNPPIIEALCEFHFEPGQPWDLTVPGLFYEKIKGEFSKKDQLTTFGVEFKPEEKGVKQEVKATNRMRFLKEDGSALIQMEPDLLVVNVLKPYPTWEKFNPLILAHLDDYKPIANPKGLKRVGLRYINRIDFSTPLVELSEYFNFYPQLPKGLPQDHGSFNVRVEIPYDDEKDVLLLVAGDAAPSKPGLLSLLLDIYYISGPQNKVQIDDVGAWIEKAHVAVESAFEASITDRCRDLFEEE